MLAPKGPVSVYIPVKDGRLGYLTENIFIISEFGFSVEPGSP
tara:strand:- start:199 stop:324 length:126 start_codon:yes stop_codon:yes gene_type:complete